MDFSKHAEGLGQWWSAAKANAETPEAQQSWKNFKQWMGIGIVAVVMTGVGAGLGRHVGCSQSDAHKAQCAAEDAQRAAIRSRDAQQRERASVTGRAMQRPADVHDATVCTALLIQSFGAHRADEAAEACARSHGLK